LQQEVERNNVILQLHSQKRNFSKCNSWEINTGDISF